MPELVLNCPLCGSPKSSHFDTRTFKDFTVTNRLCQTCGFVYQSPRMDEEELEGFYQREYRRVYQGVEGPTVKDRFVQGGRADWFVSILERRGIRPIRVLDIGSSAGVLLEKLRESFDCNVTGIEPGEAYRQYAEKRGLTIYDGLEALQADHPQPFDLITMAHVLEHIPYPVQYLGEIRSVISDDGHLLLEVPNLYTHDSFEIAHTSAFSPHALVEALGLGGWEVVMMWKHGHPRSQVLPLYLTVLARPMDERPNRIRPERLVETKRKLGMLRRKIVTRLMPGKAWVRLPEEMEENT